MVSAKLCIPGNNAKLGYFWSLVGPQEKFNFQPEVFQQDTPIAERKLDQHLFVGSVVTK